MSSKDQQTILLNCYSDLYRAAKAFYLNPEGRNYLVFLRHCQKELKKIQVKEVGDILPQLSEVEKKIIVSSGRFSVEQRQNLADKMLTLGILLKNLGI